MQMEPVERRALATEPRMRPQSRPPFTTDKDHYLMKNGAGEASSPSAPTITDNARKGQGDIRDNPA
jgi:hypothetical protein